MEEEEAHRFSHSGLVARSPQGHAAKSMPIKGNEDIWVEIQAHTFRNWVNDMLKETGYQVRDLSTDLCDGVRLVALVEVLQKRKLRKILKPVNQHQSLENATTALNAISADGIKLVNIGNVDIINGNLKLILGLIWSLIVHYQIGRSNFPARKLMLAWLRAVLPESNIHNFTTDWNSGKNLAALLDYCKPGLFPHWRKLDPKNSVDNCRVAMELARDEFEIPMVLEPEYLASPFLDELSGMTYLSYFMKENSPGYFATMRWVQSQLPSMNIKNFTTDWNDGLAVCNMVRSLGGPVPGFKNMERDPEHWVSNLEIGLTGGERLGVEPVLRATDMADPKVEHLGVMAYAAYFQWVKARKNPAERLAVTAEGKTARVNKPAHFKIDYLCEDIDLKDITAVVRGPNGKVDCRLNLTPTGGTGTFIPTEVGMHELFVYCEGEVVNGCPIHIRALPETAKSMHTGLDPCAVGSIVEVLINSDGATGGSLEVNARAPSDRILKCPVNNNKGVYTATFQPDEAGEWKINVTYEGRHIQESPFTCFVFDPHAVKLSDLSGAFPDEKFTFTCDATAAGWGETKVDIVYRGRSIPHKMHEVEKGVYRISFTPEDSGKHRIYVYFNGIDVKGSPFRLRVGADKTVPDTSYTFGNDSSLNASSRSVNKSRIQNDISAENILRQISANLQRGKSNSALSLHNGFTNFHETKTAGSLLNNTGVSDYELRSNSIDRRHLSELNRESKYSSATRESRRDLLERSHERLRSPEKILSLRRSSAEDVDGSSQQQVAESSLSRRIQQEDYTDSVQRVDSFQERKSNFVQEKKVFSSSSSRQQEGTFSSPSIINGAAQPIQEKRSIIDNTSNVRVSSMLNAIQQRRDSWDALAKTRVAMSPEEETQSFNSSRSVQQIQQESKVSRSLFSSGTRDESDAVHSRLATHRHFDVNDVVVEGEGIRLSSVGRSTSFTLESPDIDAKDVSVKITNSGRQVPVQVQNTINGVSISFTTSSAGEHLIDVQLKGQRVPGSPFRCFAYNAKEIRVGNVPNGIVGRPVEFEIDGSTAGAGNLEILVNGGHVTSYVKELGGQRFLASFVPHQATVHTIDMTFNGERVTGSPWKVEVSSSSPGATMSSKPFVLGEGVRHFAAGKISSFDVNAGEHGQDQITIAISSPSKRSLSSRIIEVGGNIYRVEFNPSEVGSYVIDVTLAGQKIQGSPFVAKAYDSSLIRVSDVTNGVVGQPCQFRVDASQAGEGQLEISINDGEVPNHVQVLGGGKCLVSFTPEVPKLHTIEIKFNGETVPGCPFMCKVADTNRVSVSLRNMELVPVGEVTRFDITVDATTNSELAVSVKGPTSDLPVKVSGGARNTFTAEFTPREVGSHTINVEYNGVPVTGTPFICKAYDANKVYVSAMPRGLLGKSLQFTVDASQAGEGNLEITISARGRNIPTHVHPQGSARFAVSFVPLEAIDHVITITFNKEPVSGSPFTAQVFTDPNRVVVSGQSLASSAVGKTSYFKMSNVTGSIEDIEVNIEGPLGNSVAAQVKDNGDNTFQVEFTPKAAGEHKIHVNYDSKPVVGSPFSCKVYDVNAIKVKEAPKGVVGKPVTFLVETSQAGPGNLEVTVNGGQVPTSAQAHGLHTYAISFTPKEPKAHEVELKFNGESVPGSPFVCQVIDSRQVTVSGEGLEKVAIDRETLFYIDVQGPPSTLDVRIISPSRRVIPSTIEAVTDFRYQVQYVPTEVGDHSIEVKYADLPIHGSPLVVKAYDANKVKVTDVTNGVVGKSIYFSIDASQAGAGNLEIIVAVNGRHVPNYVQSEGNAKFRVSFKPQEPLPHTLSVRFNGEPVPGSPFTCRVADASQVIVSGSGTKMSPLTKAAQLLIDSRGAEISDCRITVVSTNGQNVPVRMESTKDGKINAEFVPFEVGPHTVSVVLNGELVAGSPFICNIYDVSRVLVTGLGPSEVGHSITFTVDASQAGEGTLELVVTTRKSSVKADVRARSRGLYDVTFIPQEAVPHFVNITFNDEDVPGSPFKCEITQGNARDDKQQLAQVKRESEQIIARGEGLKEVVLGTPAFFEIDTKGLDGPLDIRISGPNGSTVASHVARTKTGIFRAEYEPEMVGTYRVEVLHQGKAVTSNPFFVEVTDPAAVRVTEIQEAYAGKESYFIVDTSEAGRGTLHVALRAGNQNVKHNVQNLGNGLLKIVYFPKVAHAHRVDLRYSGVHASGCPFEIQVKNPYVGKEIIAHGAGLYQGRSSKVTSFVIDTIGLSSRLIDVVVAGPKDMAVPVRCYQQKDGNLLAEFTATVPGPYKIDVLYDGKPIRGSPFYSQIYDCSRVSVDGVRSATVGVHEPISFQLKKKDAGLAPLDVSVTTPLGRELPLEVKSLPNDQGDVVEFFPTLPGKYKFTVSYGATEIPGSPFIFNVEEEGMPKAHGDGLYSGTEGVPGVFYVDAKGLSGELNIQVDGPDSVAKCQTSQEANGLYKVSYTPLEVGVFDIRVLWNGRDIAGSPYHPKVVNPRKVRVIGGWESLTDGNGRLLLTVGEDKKISFDTSEAGPGQLGVDIRGPSGPVDASVEAVTPQRSKVRFTPPETGDYVLNFTWNRASLAPAPLQATATAAVTEAATLSKSRASSVSSIGSVGDFKVILTGRGLAEAACGQEAEFTIDASKAGPGFPEVTLSGISSDLNVSLIPLENNIFKAVYKPELAGIYLLNVMWADRRVKGCPLKVTVNPVSDASKVTCSGDGLKWGIIGKEIKSFIDTRKSGPGELSANCVGPNKVAFCDLLDHHDGTYTLNIKPQEPGKHSLHVKYGGNHVPGSPFALRVMGAPDATKVRVYGPGIEHGVLATFQSRFLCDTKGAGAGQLTVRVRGPKGAFRVEMQRENQKDRTIACKYDPTEPGDYRIEVRWSGDHVPGSPFNVMIFDTQEELGRYVQGGYSPQTNIPQDFYGSLGYSTGYGHMNMSAMSWRGSQK